MPPIAPLSQLNGAGAPTVSVQRRTTPTYYSPYSGTGIGVVPRRGLDETSRKYLAGDASVDPRCLHQFAATYPLRLLSLLKDTHPLIGLAWLNNQALAFSPGDTRIVALKDISDDQGRPVVDDGGTALLDDLWNRVGGLSELQQAAGDQAMTAGLVCVEAVPGPRGGGVADVFTFDPLSVRFRVGKGDEPPLVAQQLQTAGAWVDLPAETVWCRALHGSRDNPYGRPLFSAALTEGLEDARTQRNLGDVLHAVAWPRYWASVPLTALIQYASENYLALGLAAPGTLGTEDGPQTPVAWAHEQAVLLKELMETVKAAETIIRGDGGEMGVLNGGAGLSGTEGTLATIRHRLVMSVCQPPTLLGIDTGGTKAYSSTQWAVYVTLIQFLRAFVNGILVAVADLHLRLLGLSLTARADVEPIRTEDLLRMVQAEAGEIANQRELIKMGFTTAEEASVKLTGSGPADPEKAARIGEALAIAPAAPVAGGATGNEGQQAPPAARLARLRPHAHAPTAEVDEETKGIRDGILERARERRRKREEGE